LPSFDFGFSVGGADCFAHEQTAEHGFIGHVHQANSRSRRADSPGKMSSIRGRFVSDA
jgi:hypothetical protein